MVCLLLFVLPGFKTAFGSIAFHSEIWMTVVMSNQGYPDAIRQLAVEKVVRKPFQVGPAKTRFDRVKPSRVCSRQRDHLTQLLFEFPAQCLRHLVVTLERFRNVVLNGGMILDFHLRRRDSTRCQNSPS